MVYIAVVYADLRYQRNVNILQGLLAWKDTGHHLRNGAEILQTFHHPVFLLDADPPTRQFHLKVQLLLCASYYLTCNKSFASPLEKKCSLWDWMFWMYSYELQTAVKSATFYNVSDTCFMGSYASPCNSSSIFPYRTYSETCRKLNLGITETCIER